MMFTPADSFMAERDSIVKSLLDDLGDRQNAPEESVFKNLKIMRGRPARQLLMGMNAFSHALGVSCRYCHVVGHWKDDDKKPKTIARAMMRMSGAINDSLAAIDFGDDHPHAGCMTCHRGEKEPMHAMNAMMRQQQSGGPGGGPGGMMRDSTRGGRH